MLLTALVGYGALAVGLAWPGLAGPLVAVFGLGRLLFPLGLGYHALHHLAPAVPFHHLPAAHARLVQALPPTAPYRHTVHREVCGVLRQRLDAARARG